MTIRNIINNVFIIKEGIAELAGQNCYNIANLNSFLEETKIYLKNPNNLKEFKVQYPTSKIFIERAFLMYNKKISQGYIRNNSNNNFEKSAKPILLNFYNSL